VQDLWREGTNRVLLTGSSIGTDGAFGSLRTMDLFSAPPYVRRSWCCASKAATVDRADYGGERIGIGPVAV